jgi:CheY-like chemotaxis protein
VKDRIFEPFFTTKDRGNGTGFGLSTIHGIVEQAGGRISVYSEPGLGTAFKIYLPISEEAGAAPLAQEARGDAGTSSTGGRILLVEDDETIRKLTERVLVRAGFNVTTSMSSEAALECYEGAGSVDLLLTDVIMPGMSGPQLAEQLESRGTGFKTLYMSGYTHDVIAERGLLDVGELIEKPFSPQELVDKINEILEAD